MHNVLTITAYENLRLLLIHSFRQANNIWIEEDSQSNCDPLKQLNVCDNDF